MGRLIDADALIPMMKYATTDSEIGVFPIKIGFNDIEKVINEQPTVVPERKKGEWGRTKDGVYCSACYLGWNFITGVPNEVETRYHFCPNCGADMRGEQ